MAVHVSTQVGPGGNGMLTDGHGTQRGDAGVPAHSAGVTQHVPTLGVGPQSEAESTWEHDAPATPQSEAVVHVSVPMPHWAGELPGSPFCLRTQSFQ